MIYIGIDPGSAGGIAVDWNGHVTTKSMPKTDTDIMEYLAEFKGENVSVMMEKVGGFIGFRKRIINILCPHCKGTVPYEIKEGDPGSAMFKFGDGNGYLRGICRAFGFRYDTIAPKSWQKVFNLFKTKYMGKQQWKSVLKNKAQQFYPDIKVTLATADALLILEFLKRTDNKYNVKNKHFCEQGELPF